MTPEGAIQKSIMDWLAAERILAFRMNTGAVKTDARFFRFGVPGMADIVSFHQVPVEFGEDGWGTLTKVCWIEVKTAKGRQSEFQKSFQRQVEEAGHRYVLARDLQDVIDALAV